MKWRYWGLIIDRDRENGDSAAYFYLKDTNHKLSLIIYYAFCSRHFGRYRSLALNSGSTPSGNKKERGGAIWIILSGGWRNAGIKY